MLQSWEARDNHRRRLAGALQRLAFGVSLMGDGVAIDRQQPQPPPQPPLPPPSTDSLSLEKLPRSACGDGDLHVLIAIHHQCIIKQELS